MKRWELVDAQTGVLVVGGVETKATATMLLYRKGDRFRTERIEGHWHLQQDGRLVAGKKP